MCWPVVVEEVKPSESYRTRARNKPQQLPPGLRAPRFAQNIANIDQHLVAKLSSMFACFGPTLANAGQDRSILAEIGKPLSNLGQYRSDSTTSASTRMRTDDRTGSLVAQHGVVLQSAESNNSNYFFPGLGLARGATKITTAGGGAQGRETNTWTKRPKYTER